MQIDENRIEATSEVIAFYLPQFHPIPENDVWWGRGFTEWTNVARGRPRFPGHIQPRLPTDLGFYDLRVPETRAAQAALARAYGVTAFCYYHYWFNGRRLLERPFNEVLKTGEPDFPFLLCWANENWTRRWDGHDREVLLGQSYSVEDDRNHLRALAPAFADRRYFRMNGLPVFLVYRTELLPDAQRTADVWREEAYHLGLGDIILGRVESFASDIDPKSVGFDFAVEFAPRWSLLLQRQYGEGARAGLRRRGFLNDGYTTNSVYSYRDLVNAMIARPEAQYPLFRCACTSWDNSPRRKSNATIYQGATPELFRGWIERLIAARKPFQNTRPPIFVNAWNEWAEGAHLEPCSVFGHGFLQAIHDGVTAASSVTRSTR